MYKLIKILPGVLQEFQQAGKTEVFCKLCDFVGQKKFPMSNIAFLLFLDVVNWYSTKNMRFQYSETLQFWKIGQRLFHSRFLRFMLGLRIKTTASSVYPVYALDMKEGRPCDSKWTQPQFQTINSIVPRYTCTIF